MYRLFLLLVALQPLAVGAEAQDPLGYRTVTALPFQIEGYWGDSTVLHRSARALTDGVAEHLKADATIRWLPSDRNQRPADPETGRLPRLFYMVGGTIQALGIDSIIVTWKHVRVADLRIIAQGRLHVAIGREADASSTIVAQVAATLVGEPNGRLLSRQRDVVCVRRLEEVVDNECAAAYGYDQIWSRGPRGTLAGHLLSR